jgi:hypothetical protein
MPAGQEAGGASERLRSCRGRMAGLRIRRVTRSGLSLGRGGERHDGSGALRGRFGASALRPFAWVGHRRPIRCPPRPVRSHESVVSGIPLGRHPGGSKSAESCSPYPASNARMPSMTIPPVPRDPQVRPRREPRRGSGRARHVDAPTDRRRQLAWRRCVPLGPISYLKTRMEGGSVGNPVWSPKSSCFRVGNGHGRSPASTRVRRVGRRAASLPVHARQRCTARDAANGR